MCQTTGLVSLAVPYTAGSARTMHDLSIAIRIGYRAGGTFAMLHLAGGRVRACPCVHTTGWTIAGCYLLIRLSSMQTVLMLRSNALLLSVSSISAAWTSPSGLTRSGSKLWVEMRSSGM